MTLSPIATHLINAALRHIGACTNHTEDEPRHPARYLWHTPEGFAVPLCVGCEAAWSGDALMDRTDKPLMVEKIGD